MKWINNITGLFVGENSYKRQMGIIAGVLLTLAYWKGMVDKDTYDLLILGVTAWTGIAFSAKLTKIAKTK